MTDGATAALPDHDPYRAAAVADEQQFLDRAHDRRHELLHELDRTLDLDGTSSGDMATAVARHDSRRRRELRDAAEGLVFGRLDALDGTTRHLGRIGLAAADADDPLVVDWRAPAARAFYTATAVDPLGQARRRHIRTSGCIVLDIDDEPLDAAGTGDLVGSGALFAALDERRTGRMGTAVATLQREQDEIVRADVRGPLVVQGGPGTGKTVVALHRVAYLLFADPHVARRGVLVLGPSARFLDYIDQVLPALGESAVVPATCDTLVPGAIVRRVETRALAEIKGRALWQAAIDGHVASLLPEASAVTLVWDGERYRIPRERIDRALSSATAERGYHPARAAFAERLRQLLVDAVIERREQALAEVEEGFEDILGRVDASLGRRDDRASHRDVTGSDVNGLLDEDEIDALRDRVAADRRVGAAVDAWWPQRDAGDTLRAFLHDPDLLRTLAPDLSQDEIDAVGAEPDDWSPSDIALLDAVSAALGDSEAPADQAEEFVAARASATRSWVYAHVVVDEAQELSPMQWQMVLRRCPQRAITVVGDIDQTEAPHRHTSWRTAVGSAFGDRWHEAALTICYRTPREVMELTGPVLERAGSTNEPPRAIRSSGHPAWERVVALRDLPMAARRAVDELSTRWHGGTVGVVTARQHVDRLREALPNAVVVTPTEAKGLEWDAALVVDADAIAAEPRGWNRLYVALTRCTQELGRLVVTPGHGAR
jgi:DNA helicase IV